MLILKKEELKNLVLTENVKDANYWNLLREKLYKVSSKIIVETLNELIHENIDFRGNRSINVLIFRLAQKRTLSSIDILLKIGWIYIKDQEIMLEVLDALGDICIDIKDNTKQKEEILKLILDTINIYESEDILSTCAYVLDNLGCNLTLRSIYNKKSYFDFNKEEIRDLIDLIKKSLIN